MPGSLAPGPAGPGKQDLHWVEAKWATWCVAVSVHGLHKPVAVQAALGPIQLSTNYEGGKWMSSFVVTHGLHPARKVLISLD